MLRFRRVRTAAPVGAFAVALGLVTGPADPVAEAAPRVLRGTRWYLKDSFTGGTAGVGLAKQTPGTPAVGDWDSRP
jgi:hypothetical protein